MEKIFSITLKNDISEIKTLNKKLEELASSDELLQKNIFKINLSLDEIVTNIISYGLTEETESEINIDFFKENDKLKICVEDKGVEFNPLEAEKPDTELPAEERQIGGLGIHFVRKSMDAMEYRREGEKNILTLTKLLTN